MSLLDRAVAFLLPPSPHEVAAAHFRSALANFQKTRSEDLAHLLEQTEMRGAELARCRRELAAWRSYARELERLCMAAGLEMPRSPDE